ncbi:hypothetical protein Ocin01_03195 [Orchesella cincta]|uniref:Uncharacterized protein n=1 Tax=Orchesella cincta TaxID=48709 RepID=A0A1D2NE69_ORCCI|nr:hypothetical protein Ocin01_03195 [Orchesella cincta]
MSEINPVWTTAQKLLDSLEPCDIVEIRYEKARPPRSHFIFNIRKGWCVNVIPGAECDSIQSHDLFPGDDDGSGVYEGFKDATDFVALAGRNLCRINNLDDLAQSYNLTPRSRKEALQISRAGLADGAVVVAIKTKIPGDPSTGQDLSKQFCLYWKYNGAAKDADSGNKFLDKTIAVCGLVLVLLAAVVATTLSM